MLVLTRRPGEQIVIGHGIRVTVVSVGPGRVKIGVEAPSNIRIDRSEIHEKIQQEQASDVLAVVGRAPNTDDPAPTAVVSGDTDLKLHNRIAGTLPVPAVNGSATAGTTATDQPPPADPPRYRLPRKPR
ncbi:MAG TPA: carbon storage regulator [Gemmataceae bacterium]|nr:carbon storage regulator [Gemmataceae bacterium]